jgi:hypothetical protein
MRCMRKSARKSRRDTTVDAATLDVLTDPELMRQIRQSKAEIAAGTPELTMEQVFDEPVRRSSKKRR